MPSDQFTTDRLAVHSWASIIGDKRARKALETALKAILTPRVLKHLPPSLQLHEGENDVASWVDARAAESEIMLVNAKTSGKLVGLVIMARVPDTADIPTVHLGYLLAEATWGQGLASELLKGLLSAMHFEGRMRLVGGVNRTNSASARVLQKAGFIVDPSLSVLGMDMYVCNV